MTLTVLATGLAEAVAKDEAPEVAGVADEDWLSEQKE